MCAPSVDELNSSRRQFRACTRDLHVVVMLLLLLLLLLSPRAASNNAFRVFISSGRLLLHHNVTHHQHIMISTVNDFTVNFSQ